MNSDTIHTLKYRIPDLMVPEAIGIIHGWDDDVIFESYNPTYLVNRKQYIYAKSMQLIKPCFGGHYVWNINCLGCGFLKQRCAKFTDGLVDADKGGE